jgi:hypothetical protein
MHGLRANSGLLCFMSITFVRLFAFYWGLLPCSQSCCMAILSFLVQALHGVSRYLAMVGIPSGFMVDALWFIDSLQAMVWYGGHILQGLIVCVRCMATVLRAGMAWFMVPGLVLCSSTLFPLRCFGRLLSSEPSLLMLCHPHLDPGTTPTIDIYSK